MAQKFNYPRSSYYISENILDWDGQMSITKLSPPMAFVRFNYRESYFTDYETWVTAIVVIDWIGGDKASPEEKEEILTDCWNFLALHEAEEEKRAEDYEDEDDWL